MKGHNHKREGTKEYGSIERNAKRSVKKRYLLITAIGLLILICVGIVGAVTIYKNSKNQVVDSKPNNNDHQNVPVSEAVHWYNNDFPYYQGFAIKNTSDSTFKKGTTVSIPFDHAKLVNIKHASQSGKDTALVSENKKGEYQLLQFKIKNPNTSSALIQFILPSELTTDDELMIDLYYGNEVIENEFTLDGLDNTDLPADSMTVTLGAESFHPVTLDISRKWVLKGGNSLDLSYRTSQFKVSSSSERPISKATFEILNDKFVPIRNLSLVRNTSGQLSTSIDTLGYEPGIYYVQTSIQVEGITIVGPRKKINISWPLYVNWSIDWEGSGVEDRWLQMIEALSTKYNVPITHYFNPRHYVGGMTTARADSLTKWVLDRQKKGDEIGLHLHMWFDMVQAVGITPKKEPTWTVKPENTGHDVPGAIYSAEDFDKMLKWAKGIFKTHGLPDPKIYRAGGWSVTMDHLKVLASNGFTVDASGRSVGSPGSFYVMPHPWTLLPTSHPYKVSNTNINVAGTTSSNTLPIWEFPNNGENSSNYGANNTKLIDSFKLNYSGKPLAEKQVYSVLSHVQYFHIDQPIMDRYFTEMLKYTSSNDNGPVVYTTIENVLPEYENPILN